MKQTTDANYIQQLITEGEHVHQDFKFAISDARKIAKSLSAFANTGGGRLLIGVKDNGKIAGIRSEEELYMIEAAATMYCKPALQLENQLYRVKAKMYWRFMFPKARRSLSMPSMKTIGPRLTCALKMKQSWPLRST